MFGSATRERTNATARSLIARGIKAGLMAAAGCAVAAPLATAAPMTAGARQPTIATAEGRLLHEQRVAHARRDVPRRQPLAGTFNEPVGEGWG